MRQLKPLLTFALCLIVLATSVTQAVARRQMAGGQMMQICANGQAISVMIDAQGNPLGPTHTCPDCVGLPAALLPSSPVVQRPFGPALHLSLPNHTNPVARAILTAHARGPPALI